MYTLDIIVSKEDVRIIKEQFQDFIEAADGFTITVESNTGVNPSPELNDVIKKLFFHFMMTLHFGKFRGVN